MKWLGTKDWGKLLLSIWLIATGVLQFVHVPLVNMDMVRAGLAGLAIAAGVLILLGR